MVELVKFDTKMNIAAIWVLAKREILEFWRNKARVISVFAQSIMFLLIFSMGFAFISIKIEKSLPLSLPPRINTKGL